MYLDIKLYILVNWNTIWIKSEPINTWILNKYGRFHVDIEHSFMKIKLQTLLMDNKQINNDNFKIDVHGLILNRKKNSTLNSTYAFHRIVRNIYIGFIDNIITPKIKSLS